jgi:epoxyqueuosine reductase
LGLDEAGFAARFAESPIKRIGLARLLRNVCVAVGNWGSETAVPQLITLLTDPEPIIRGHAAWALHQIGTDAAKTAVVDAIPHEIDGDVLIELYG